MQYSLYRLPENLSPGEAARRFPFLAAPRAENSHKGTFGTLAVFGGAQGMAGAVVLAASAALLAGCGKVWAGFHREALPMPFVAGFPEIMQATADTLARRGDVSARAAGCGLGTAEGASRLLGTLFQTASDTPLLLDADALNLLAGDAGLADAAARYPTLVITPHPAEAARLLGTATAQIQSRRADAVRRLAERFGAVAVLKGHRTLVCRPGGETYENRSGNAGLATAGSGDVLSGIIGSLLAQGCEPFEAACAGVWLHGAAADILAASGMGPAGLLAGEIAPAARWLRNMLIDNELK
ncbi:Nicotinamide nucleotide repair protein [Kingella potus]|uniref:ADP-dependent (S)-NAD(P)H-hydrate dehydratase n=1 Tax=Kingella potus TaxID=265175 RepID=A0A377R2J2_9NEIS|nr:NAD(P)H-hydrate dehydratase [Kingella potus]STR00511.1 Nicotinamide nucleotide repair protein [Kingella potus]